MVIEEVSHLLHSVSHGALDLHVTTGWVSSIIRTVDLATEKVVWPMRFQRSLLAFFTGENAGVWFSKKWAAAGRNFFFFLMMEKTAIFIFPSFHIIS